jgi:hypothetical protein
MSAGPPGEPCQGRGVSADGQHTTDGGLLQRAGALRRPDRPLVRLGLGPRVAVTGRRAEGARGVTSIASG